MNPDLTQFSWKLSFKGDRKGLPLLWLHGFMGSAQDWTSLLDEHFSEYNNIVADLPGHGQSTLLENTDLSEIIADLQLQLTENGINSFIPIGYSMGGRIGLYLLSHLKNNIPAFIGISTAPGLKTGIERDQRRCSDTELMDRLDDIGYQEFLRTWYELPLFQSINKNSQLISNLVKSRSQNIPEQLRRSLELLGNGAFPSLWDSMSDIHLPVLLMGGSLDLKYRSINKEMVQVLPQGQQVIIDDGDHAFHLEKPLETAQLIRHFLRESIKGVRSVSN